MTQYLTTFLTTGPGVKPHKVCLFVCLCVCFSSTPHHACSQQCRRSGDSFWLTTCFSKWDPRTCRGPPSVHSRNICSVRHCQHPVCITGTEPDGAIWVSARVNPLWAPPTSPFASLLSQSGVWGDSLCPHSALKTWSVCNYISTNDYESDRSLLTVWQTAA